MSINWTNVLLSLEILWKGMVGIFAACIVIIIAVWIMSKLTGGKRKN